MAFSLEDKLVVAISSRALFDFEEENHVYETGDLQAYEALQRSRLEVPAEPGVAFALIRKLLALNTEAHRVEVVILSRSDPISGLRAFRSCREHGLAIERGVFTRGRPPFGYLKPLNASLFLSANPDDVRDALAGDFPAARVLPESARMASKYPEEIRIAFDGDAVLFSDEAERVFQKEGLDAFVGHETDNKHLPLADGPLKPLLGALHRLQKLADHAAPMRIRTALVTARSAPAHERAIRTLMNWNIEIDEAMFLGGLDKGAFLREFEPDFFFDDQIRHCESARVVTRDRARDEWHRERTMTPEHSPLGKAAAYGGQYDAALLFPIARSGGRETIGIGALPFFGVDIWNAYELSWLNTRGKPQLAIATFLVPAESPNIVESKSLKLYLGSFAQTAFDSIDEVRDAIRRDVSAICGAHVSVQLTAPYEFVKLKLEELEGVSLDRLDLDTDVYRPDSSLLKAAFDEAPVEETVFSNLLKSNCPVTGQPDWGSVQIHYVGPQIDHAGLLRYVISYREHTGFHEQCVEKMFVDILQACRPVKLAVYARYTRRGGIDINPFRTNFNLPLPDNFRTARQ